ncbi:hypothetical protein J8273_8738 [Carpediemonas membranifera]|uniref:Uncharacterized protein n=1 Tax=Carpediemonas membranifera TaxID=201153 RepID=A0A8J6AP35_9EUKA|nr:hypothetical protein J8273_8738 [Carpediemonas membranifera]|eukprot:KAG9389446.1 hypothetical protein J8273_8738 [Carpediemonas membranifera]
MESNYMLQELHCLTGTSYRMRRDKLSEKSVLVVNRFNDSARGRAEELFLAALELAPASNVFEERDEPIVRKAAPQPAEKRVRSANCAEQVDYPAKPSDRALRAARRAAGDAATSLAGPSPTGSAARQLSADDPCSGTRSAVPSMSLAESASSGSVGSSSVAIADTGASASAINPTARAKPKPKLTGEIDVEQFLSSWASSTKLEAAGARELKFISKSDLKSVIRNERVQSVERICNIAWVAYQMELYNELENDGVAIDDCIVPTEQLEVLQARVSEALMRPTRELIDGTRKVWNYRATYAGMVKSICDSMATMLFIDPGTVT